MVEENPVACSSGAARGDASRPWERLSSGFEQARAGEDSLDRLVEWPAQRALLGDVRGLAVLDAGCGNGAKLAQLASEGAAVSVGVDISGNFITVQPGVELIEGDLYDLSAVPGLAGRRFDRILFLQSFGYAAESVQALRTAREMLTQDGFILLTRTQPIRYAIERAEQNGTSLRGGVLRHRVVRSLKPTSAWSTSSAPTSRTSSDSSTEGQRAGFRPTCHRHDRTSCRWQQSALRSR